MSDDNFFNKSINDQAATGFATSYVDVSGTAVVGTNYVAGATAILTVTLPPASIGEGAIVTIVNGDASFAVSVGVDAAVPLNTINNLVAPLAVLPIGVHAFVSDGVGNWTYTA